MEKVEQYTFQVQPFQEDCCGELSWAALGNLLLRCAQTHASARGFGELTIDGQRYVWVLSRLVIEMRRMPRIGETFVIETWVRSVYRSFTDRCFRILSSGGDEVGEAYTVWAMINMETRMPASMQQIADAAFLACIDASRPLSLRPGSRPRVKAESSLCELRAVYCDIDCNRHVNSIRYVEHMLDLFSVERYLSQRVRRLEVAYSEETYPGEMMRFYKGEEKDSEVCVEVRKVPGGKEDGGEALACSGKLTFEKREKDKGIE